MKKLLLLLSILGTALTTKADVLTVSNNPNSPGQYTDFQTAIDASSPNDTILVQGSATSYGSVSLTWPLTLIGAGYNNPYGENTKVSYIYLKRTNTSIGANDTKISGFIITYEIDLDPRFSGGDYTTQVLENIVIERCSMVRLRLQTPATYNNIYFRNCTFSGYVGLDVYSVLVANNIKFDNNVFSGNFQIRMTGADLSSVIFSNNIFLDGNNALFTSTSVSHQNPKIVLENNIFYGVEPEGCVNCAFNNNITYQCNNNQLIYAGNMNSVGSGNLINQDPEFVNYPFLGGPFDYAHDYNLAPSSPGVDAGTDGTDIGLYGGSSPMGIGINPSIPQMMYVTFPNNSSVEVGGSLEVEFKSHKQD